MKVKKIAPKKKKKLGTATLKINARKNNVFFTITSVTGDVVEQTSCGICGYRNARKNTPSSVRAAFESAKSKLIALGLSHQSYGVEIRGFGPGINEVNILLPTLPILPSYISYIENAPHGGTTLPKIRRV